jgi:hypothetical protein
MVTEVTSFTKADFSEHPAGFLEDSPLEGLPSSLAVGQEWDESGTKRFRRNADVKPQSAEKHLLKGYLRERDPFLKTVA